MNRDLKKITIEKAGQIIPDKELLRNLKKDERIFGINKINDLKTDELVDIEVAFRKAKRLGALEN